MSKQSTIEKIMTYNDCNQLTYDQSQEMLRDIDACESKAELFAQLMQVAAQGNAIAQHNIGYMYENGHGVQCYYQSAMEWYKKAAEQGNNTAQNSIGCMYSEGVGVEQNNPVALEWYHQAAEQGNANAQYMIGLNYYLDNDPELALEWMLKASDQEFRNAKISLEAFSPRVLAPKIAELSQRVTDLEPKISELNFRIGALEAMNEMHER